MKTIPGFAFCIILLCLHHTGKTQVTISEEARVFCGRLKQTASAGIVKITDSIAGNYRGSSITEKDIMDIVESMGKAGDAGMAIAIFIVFTIAETNARTPVNVPSNNRGKIDSLKNNIRAKTSIFQTPERKQEAVMLLNSMFNKNRSRQNQILRSLN